MARWPASPRRSGRSDGYGRGALPRCTSPGRRACRPAPPAGAPRPRLARARPRKAPPRRSPPGACTRRKHETRAGAPRRIRHVRCAPSRRRCSRSTPRRSRAPAARDRAPTGAAPAPGWSGRPAAPACAARRHAGMSLLSKLPPRKRPQRPKYRVVAPPTRWDLRQPPEPGEDVLSVEVQEAPLVAPGRVEDEVGKAKVQVELDLRHVLIWIVGDQPAARRALDGQCGGAPLELNRVIDPRLLLGLERQRCPLARLRHRSLPVEIERNLDLDQLLERAGIAPGLAGPLVEGRQELVPVEPLTLAAGADQAVGGAPGIASHLRAAGGNVDGRRLSRPIVDRGIARPIVRALERDALLAPEPVDELQRLAQAADALAELRPLDTQCRHLVERLAGPNTEQHASGEEAAERAHRLSDHR